MCLSPSTPARRSRPVNEPVNRWQPAQRFDPLAVAAVTTPQVTQPCGTRGIAVDAGRRPQLRPHVSTLVARGRNALPQTTHIRSASSSDAASAME